MARLPLSARDRHEPPAVQQISGGLDASQCACAGEDLRLLRHQPESLFQPPQDSGHAPCIPAGTCGPHCRRRSSAWAEHAAAGLLSLLCALAARAREMRARGTFRLPEGRRSRCSAASPSSVSRVCASAITSRAAMTASCSNPTRRDISCHQPQGLWRDEPRLDRGGKCDEPGFPERPGTRHGPLGQPLACGPHSNIAGHLRCCGG